jgi:hypothetical protein
MRITLLFSLVAALALVGGAGGRALAEPPAELFVFPFDTTLGARAETDVDLSLPASSTLAIASVVEEVPSGTAVALDATPGLAIGTATIFLAGDPAPVSAGLFAADLAPFTTDPAAQACSPGPHAAVWTAALDGLPLAIFVDPDPTGATTLTYCLTQPPARIVDVDLDLQNVVTNATAAGIATWRAFVTPTTGAPFEVRSLVALPQTLTFRATYATRTNALALRGTLLSAGKPRPRVNVHFAVATRADLSDAIDIGVAQTRVDGSYALARAFARKRTAQHLILLAYVNFYVGDCSEPPLLPGGCAEQSIAPPPAQLVSLTVPKRR